MNKRFDEDIWILEKLAFSGSYDLYLALWPEVGEKVLVKHVNPELEESKRKETEERLLKEAATLEEFWSPFFPKIYDIRKRESDDSLYLICQYFEGIPLDEMLQLHRDSFLPKDFYLKLKADLNFALSYLHNKKGVAHLDLSPDNIIVGPEKDIHIIDFENSKLIGEPLDREMLRGKKRYMAPELLEERESLIIKKDFDLYSLSIILSEAKALTKKSLKERIPKTFYISLPIVALLAILIFLPSKTNEMRKPTKELATERKAPLIQKIQVKQAALKRKQKAKEVVKKPVAAKKANFQDQLHTMTQARYLEAKQCLQLFEPNIKTVEIDITLKGKNGKPKSIKLQSPKKIKAETKICLESLFSDIKFPATSGNKETLYKKRFNF